VSGRNAVDVNPARGLSIRQANLRLIVYLLACDDVHFAARARKVKCQIGQNLAGGRMIRKEETIDENDAPHFDDKWLQQASELPRLGLNRAPIVGHEHWEKPSKLHF
jgi:hypothetical protein